MNLTVRIVGTGLLGTSLALALRRLGAVTQLSDASPVQAGLAEDLGAGELVGPDSGEPDLVVVATPPDVAADLVLRALEEHPGAVVTDLASVKSIIAAEVGGAERYVGSHPMAGRERSGAVAADADLFAGRPWVVVPHPASDGDAIALIRQLATEVGAVPVEMNAPAHDAAVARVSHVPQLVSSLVAARLVDAPTSALDLSGQGLRDVTRIASSDPGLWSSIIAGNAAPVRAVLEEIADDLGRLIDGIDRIAPESGGYRGISRVAEVLAAGNMGVARIPGKHGGAPIRYATVTVLVPDEPGELGRLFTEVGDIGVNIEDLELEHSASQPVGRARIAVEPASAKPLAGGLEERGWTIAALEIEENS